MYVPQLDYMYTLQPHGAYYYLYYIILINCMPCALYSHVAREAAVALKAMSAVSNFPAKL